MAHVIHYFAAKLEFSRGERERTDIELLKSCIPGCDGVIKTPIDMDKAGVDYIATLRRGAEIKIDAKTRAPGSKRYWHHGEAELALETWSVVERKVAGWTLDESKDVDMILYTFDASEWDRFYLLPFHHLRMAFRGNYNVWVQRYGEKRQSSGRWTSAAVFVPASVVLDAIRASCVGAAGTG